MTKLPSPEALASLVSKVTETMFSMSFTLETANEPTFPWVEAPPWRVCALPIPGARPLTVVIAADEPGALALGGAMFSCPPGQVDASMVDDSLGELANIVGGQVKNLLALDQALGLPKMITDGVIFEKAKEDAWRSATLRNLNTQVRVWVALTESVA